MERTEANTARRCTILSRIIQQVELFHLHRMRLNECYHANIVIVLCSMSSNRATTSNIDDDAYCLLLGLNKTHLFSVNLFISKYCKLPLVSFFFFFFFSFAIFCIRNLFSFSTWENQNRNKSKGNNGKTETQREFN